MYSERTNMVESIQDPDRVLQTALNRIERARLSAANKRLISDFKDECLSMGLSKGRAAKYLYYLAKIGEWLALDFPDATKADIKRLTGIIQQSHYVPFSKSEMKICVKKFYKWLRDSEEYPDEVRWIKPLFGQGRVLKLPEQILTPEEITKLLQHSATDRDRAFIASIYESGCRIGEVLFVRVKHLEFDRYGALLRVDGKTGPRRVRLVACVPYLRGWLNRHPASHDPEARLWLTRNHKNLTYGGACGMLRRTAERAGIKKPVNPHSFRHARATHLANYLTDAQMKEYFGWTQASYMAAVYVHLSGRDVDNALLTRVYGLKPVSDEKTDQFRSPKCTKCGTDNPSTFRFCGLCGLPLDEETAMDLVRADQERSRVDGVMDQLWQDVEFKDLMLKKIQEHSCQPPLIKPHNPLNATSARSLPKP